MAVVIVKFLIAFYNTILKIFFAHKNEKENQTSCLEVIKFIHREFLNSNLIFISTNGVVCISFLFARVDFNFACQDYSVGFGGKYGVQKDRQDQSAHTFEEQQPLAKHESQKGER